MGSYETTIDTLAGELAGIEAAFRGLTGPEWAAATLLVPVDPDLPHWTVFELAGHFDISIGLTRMLIDGRDEQQPARRPVRRPGLGAGRLGPRSIRTTGCR